MVTQPFGSANQHLAQVTEGMAVHDQYGEKLGKVRQVYLGGEDLAEAQVAGDSVLHDVPQALRSRLAAAGFVEIDTGFLHANLYATGAQVNDVREDGVWLRVGRDDLAKK